MRAAGIFSVRSTGGSAGTDSVFPQLEIKFYSQQCLVTLPLLEAMANVLTNDQSNLHHLVPRAIAVRFASDLS